MLMPFKRSMDGVYKEAVKPACIESGFHPIRADETKGPHNITKSIIEKIFESDVVVADMTGKSPNVFYEMGVAHTISNKTICIIQKATPLPFDIQSYQCIIYNPTKKGLDGLRQEIIDSLRDFTNWSKNATNPVQDFKPTRRMVTKKEISALNLKLRQKDAKISTLERKIDSQKRALIRRLRSKPFKKLSDKTLQRVLEDKELYHTVWNPGGRGIYHDYKIEKRDGRKIVIDHNTGLCWQQSDLPPAQDYSGATKYVERLNRNTYAGHKDWRLPTIEELMSLVERKQSKSGFYINEIFGGDRTWIWSSDMVEIDTLWIVNFQMGCCYKQSAKNSYYVVGVRTEEDQH